MGDNEADLGDRAMQIDCTRLKVPELKSILLKRKISSTGYVKRDLIGLAEQALLLYGELEGDDYHDVSLKRRRVEVKGKTVLLPDPVKLKSWTVDLKTLPSLQSGHVIAFAGTHCGWTQERLQKFTLDDSYRLHTNGHIETAELAALSNPAGYLYVRLKCKPEQRQSAERYVVTIALQDDATIASAFCTCVAGCTGSCKHTVASLFSLADFSERYRDRASVVGTDIRCQWTQSRKESRPVLAKDLDFRKDKTTPLPKGVAAFNPVCHFSEADKENTKEALLNIIRATTPRSVLLKAYPNQGCHDAGDSSDSICKIPTVHSMAQEYKKQHSTSLVTDLDDFLSHCVTTMTGNIRANVAEIPQGSPAWFEQRQYRVTASIMRNVVHFTKYHSPNNYLTRKITGVECIDSKELRHGRTWEPVARAKFVEEWQQQHVNSTCRETGLHISDEYPFIAASPDGILQCDCHGTSVLEVKCTWKHWKSPLSNILADTKYHFSPTGELNDGSSWSWQIQTQLGVLKATRGYLALLHGDGKELYVQEVSFNDSKWQQIITKSQEFFSKCVLPIM